MPDLSNYEDVFRCFLLRKGIVTQTPSSGGCCEYKVFARRSLGDVAEYIISAQELARLDTIQLVWLWLYDNQTSGNTVVVACGEPQVGMKQTLWLVANTDIYDAAERQLTLLRQLKFSVSASNGITITKELDRFIAVRSTECWEMITDQMITNKILFDIKAEGIREQHALSFAHTACV